MTRSDIRTLFDHEDRAAARLIRALDAYMDATDAAAGTAAQGRILREAAAWALHHDLRRGKQGRKPISRRHRERPGEARLSSPLDPKISAVLSETLSVAGAQAADEALR